MVNGFLEVVVGYLEVVGGYLEVFGGYFNVVGSYSVTAGDNNPSGQFILQYKLPCIVFSPCKSQ